MLLSKSKKKTKQSLLSRLSNATKLPVDSLCGYPLMEIYGDRQILIEGSLNIDLYEEDKIFISYGKKSVRIFGEKLSLESLCENGLCVNGKIMSIELG